MATNNPTLSILVRIFAIVVIAVLLIGSSLFFAPDLVAARWPWTIKPFAQRFLGAFYLAELVAIVILAGTNRWSPARLILIMAAAFTVIVTAVSALNLEVFNFGRRGPWGWFVLYAGSAAISLFALWHYRDLSHPGVPPPREWRTFFRVEAGFLGLYGLTLLVVPRAAASFWPWQVETFDARVYSAIFLAAGLGAAVVARKAAPEELTALGLAQTVLGVATITGLVLADRTVGTVDWAGVGTWVWILLFASLAGFGLNALVLARLLRRERT